MTSGKAGISYQLKAKPFEIFNLQNEECRKFEVGGMEWDENPSNFIEKSVFS